MTLKIFRSSFAAGLLVLLLCSVMFYIVLFTTGQTAAFSALEAQCDFAAAGTQKTGTAYLGALQTESRITWIDADGTVLFDNRADADNMENHLDRPEVAQALESGSGRGVRFSKTLLIDALYYARRLQDGTVLRLASDKNTALSLLPEVMGPALAVAILALGLCAMLSSRLAKQITKPINQLDLDRPETWETYRELAPLSARLRQQNETIRRQMDELRQAQRETAAITENMNEGFLLLDSRGAILSGNHSAMQLLSAQPWEGERNLHSSCCRSEIRSAAMAALSGNRSEQLLRLDGASYQIIASPVSSRGSPSGAVVLMMDVTEREQRETLRREFTANVSHELKTPLTSISGFAELMKNGLVPPEKQQEFAGDIYKESRRLIALVDDIIRLSSLDENTAQPEAEDVDLYELAEGAVQTLARAAQKQQIRLNLQGQHAVVHGVRQVLNEIVFNLCDNAVKYNRPGGSVTITVARFSNEIRLVVADTGIGIPREHQARVFERFYRVDKSHSKAIGGTGLGLSIVKHGVQSMGGRIRLESEPGSGTTITVIFD